MQNNSKNYNRRGFVQYDSPEFLSFRRKFNRMWSFSFDGKFKGISYLFRISLELFNAFYAKYTRLSSMRGRRTCFHMDDVVTFRVSGHTVKLYPR